MQKFKCYFLILNLILFGILNISCGSDDGGAEPIPDSIAIQAQDSYTGGLNQQFQLVAIVRDVAGQVLANQTITWTSDNNAVATISSSGALRVVSGGEVNITAAVENITTTKTITIDVVLNLIAFQVSELSDQMETDGVATRTFIDESTMSVNLIKLATGASGTTTSPARDQVYYFYEGDGTIKVNGTDMTIEAGSVLFVSAGISRQITQVNSDMKIILTEMKSTSGTVQSPFSRFSKSKTEATRNPSQNVWNPFLNERSVTFGLYMLPRSRGGDGRLVHTTDEINIVVNGTSRFETDNGDVRVEKGSVVYVRQGNGHFFNDLTSDIDILILWNK